MAKQSPTRPSQCVMCGGELPEPASTGRPRSYCSMPCKRAAEYELRRAQSLLLSAERSEARERSLALGVDHSWKGQRHKDAAKFWAGEVERLQGRLVVLLSGAGDEDLAPGHGGAP